MSGPLPWHPDHEYRIETSDSSVTVDGYALGEPKRLSCDYCAASVLLDRDATTPGIDDLQHERGCPNRFARSHWWRARVAGGSAD